MKVDKNVETIENGPLGSPAAVDSTVLEMISSGAPLSNVLEVLCTVIEEQASGMLCSILLLDPDGRTLRHGAAPSLPQDYTRAIDGANIGPAVGSCGTAAFRGELVAVSDIASDPLWADYRDLALPHGLRACWSLPIKSKEGKALGTFAMYYREPCSPRARHLELLQHASRLAGIAIEWKRAEETLQHSQNRYRSIFENAVEGIFQTTPEGGYVSVNPALARMYGYESPKELMSAVKDIGYQVYVDLNRRAEFQKLMQKHSLVEGFEYQVYRKDGSKIWLSENARAVRDGGGVILYYEGTVQDITDRKRNELERQVMFEIMRGANVTANLEEFLQLVHQSLKKALYAENCFIALYDERDGLFHFPFFADQFDPPPEPKKLDRSCTAYVFRTNRPLLITQKVFDELVRTGRVELVGSSSPTWLGVPLQTPSKTIGVLVVQHYTDHNAYTERDLELLASVASHVALVIERKRAEEALRESESLRRAIVESEPECVKLVAADGTLLDMNPAGLAMVEADRAEQVIGKSVYDLVTAAYHETFRAFSEEVFQGESRTAEFEIIGIKGTKRWMESHACPLRNTEGKITAQLAVTRDTTERKHMEQQLRQSQKMEAIGQLAGGVAHDFNNLLTVIRGHTDLLLDHIGQTDALRRNVEQIQKSADLAASLTRQLLAFSRKQLLQPKVLDLNGVVAAMSKMLPRLIGENIALTISMAPSLGKVKADLGQIEQVILNLAVNARDAMPQGGKLTIETANVELDEAYVRDHVSSRPGPHVMLAVSDTGCGMDPETQSRIFEPFFTTKQLGKGTGIGLATVYGIVKQSGGCVWVYSEVGKGSTFKIYLPRVDEAEEVVKPTKGPAVLRMGTETVLVVEDNESLRELTHEFLLSAGYTVLVAADGVEAIRMAEQHKGRIDLLLTDVVMPGMNGCELARRLATLRPDTRALYASGYTGDAILQQGVLEEGASFLPKPFTRDALAQKVREVLEQDCAGT